MLEERVRFWQAKAQAARPAAVRHKTDDEEGRKLRSRIAEIHAGLRR